MTTSVVQSAGLVWLLSAAAAVVLPWLAAGAGESSSIAGCETSCGGVDIPFPFGIGPDHCWLPGFEISCNDVGNGVHKPFMVTVDDDKHGPTARHAKVEFLNISLEQGQVQVLHPISSYCYDAASGKMVPSEWHWDLSKDSRFSFSSTANKFTVVGCRALAYIGDPRGDAATKYQTGCLAMCFQGPGQGNTSIMSVNPCSGMGCCQTAIPQGLQYYQVWFDSSLDTSAIDGGVGLYGLCSFAVLMMDSYSFDFSTTSYVVDVGGSSNFSNISTGFNRSLGGAAPVVLDWSIGGQGGCETATRNPAGYACRSVNSSCSDAATGRGYICKCKPGFQGNPYLSDDDGCQDINECLDHHKYPCFGDCTNNIGSFDCHCSRGTRGNASIPGGCQKDPFPRGAGIIAGILVGVFVALIAFLSTEVFLNKKNKKRQGYFEQHGGQMLLRILQTDDNNIAFTLYERKDLVKATRGFHKDYVVGEGAHGTVYKATLGTATVAVKRCKQIDKSRTDEFVQEMVVLCRVRHPNIVRLLGCCLHFEAPMLVYEFVPNGTLRDLLHGKGRYPVTLPTRLRIAAETAEALAYLHSPPHPTLHGDVKPDNILLGEGWIAKVSDFGCSTINDNVQVVPKGTLAYLDPEFLQDFQITEKTDVYSFGVVLIELLSGKNPQARGWQNLTTVFHNCMENGTLGNLLDDEIVEERSMGLIYAVVKLVSQCIASPSKARPAMAQIAEELRRFSDEMPESPEARVALKFEDRSYSYTATESQATGFSNLKATSIEFAR